MSYRSKDVILTSFQKQGSFDTYISEARSIRESTFLQTQEESEELSECEDGKCNDNGLLLVFRHPYLAGRL